MTRLKLCAIVTLLLGVMMALPLLAKADDHRMPPRAMATHKGMAHHRKHHKHHKGMAMHGQRMMHKQ